MRFIIIVAVVALGGLVRTTPPQRAGSLVEQAFAAYAAGHPPAFERLIPKRELLRSADSLKRDLDALISRGGAERRALHAVFLLELAHFGFREIRTVPVTQRGQIGEPWSVEVLEKAQQLVAGRPDPPGKDSRGDAFELAWHKTTIALLAALDRPDVLENAGLDPARRRVAAAPVAGQARVIDPWIELAHALLEEQRTIVDPQSLTRRATAAIQRFDRASAFQENRVEATVRKSWLLVRLGRHEEALAALDSLGDHTAIPDAAVRYWNRLFRGRALDGLGRADAASVAYTEALAVSPSAQSAFAALTAVEIKRGNYEAGFRRAGEGVRLPDASQDPWSHYNRADFRFFAARLAHLRELSR